MLALNIGHTEALHIVRIHAIVRLDVLALPCTAHERGLDHHHIQE